MGVLGESRRFRQFKEKNMKKRLDHKALELCHAIEELPPSKQQTEISMAASALYTLLYKYCHSDKATMKKNPKTGLVEVKQNGKIIGIQG